MTCNLKNLSQVPSISSSLSTIKECDTPYKRCEFQVSSTSQYTNSQIQEEQEKKLSFCFLPGNLIVDIRVAAQLPYGNDSEFSSVTQLANSTSAFASRIHSIQQIYKACVVEITYTQSAFDHVVDMVNFEEILKMVYMNLPVNGSLVLHFLETYQQLLNSCENMRSINSDNENEFKNFMIRNKEFEISNRIAHQILIDKRFRETIGQIKCKHERDLFFYQTVKRENFGYHISRRGFSESLIKLLGISPHLLSQAYLRNGYLNFLSTTSNLRLLEFELSTRIQLANLVEVSHSNLNFQQLQLTLVTQDEIMIECEVQIEFVSISFRENSPCGNDYLMIFHVSVKDAELNRVNTMRGAKDQRTMNSSESQNTSFTFASSSSQYTQTALNFSSLHYPHISSNPKLSSTSS